MKYLPILVLAQFAALYPLFLWTTPIAKLPAGFTRFNLGMTTVLLGLATLLAGVGGLQPGMLRLLIILTLATLAAQGLLWNAPVRARAMVSPLQLVWGLTLWQPALANVTMMPEWMYWVAIALGGAVLASVMYAMILGHWYLNVVDLPLRYLQRATDITLAAMVARVVWSLYILFTADVIAQQRLKPASVLLWQLDGAFLWLGLGPGLAGAIIVTWMAKRTAKMQSTQSSTGLLYVSLLLAAMSTLSFSGYLILKDLPI